MRISTIYRLFSGEWIDDEDQIVRLKCSYIISAFGSTLNELPGFFICYFNSETLIVNGGK